MTGKKMNKVEGAHEKCFCGTPVVCVKVTYQGEDKLQWQNDDGGAHFNPPGEDGKFTCNIPVIEDPKNKRIDTAGSGQPTTAFESSTAGKTVVQEGNTINVILSDFEKIYRNGLPVATRIVTEALYFGKKPTDKDIEVSVQCVMKSLIHYWIAKAK